MSDILPGVYIHTPIIHPDERGFFAEMYKGSAVEEATGMRLDLAQTNLSFSRAGTIRGMHFTLNPPGQDKYVMCPQGRIIDVILDYTTGKWMSVELGGEAQRAVFIPGAYAHGFIAVEDSTVLYLTSVEYNPSIDRGLNPLECGIDWETIAPEIDPSAYIISTKDQQAPGIDL